MVMAQRFTVYLKQSAEGVTPAELLAGIQEVDLGEIADVCDVPSDAIEEALARLRMSRVKRRGFRWYALEYGREGTRPIAIQRWETPEVARGVMDETIEDVKSRKPPRARVICKWLSESVDTVSASFGSSPEEEMAPILASEVCRWLAVRFGGIIQAPDGKWWKPGEEPNLEPV
jgi:hypothetical protein